MYNWDYQNIKIFPQDEDTERWRHERMLVFGLGKEKLNREFLQQHFEDLRMPDDTRAFLELLLWNKPF